MMNKIRAYKAMCNIDGVDVPVQQYMIKCNPINLVDNKRHIDNLDKSYEALKAKVGNKKLSTQDEIEKLLIERQFQTYNLDKVKIENIREIRNISDMEVVIGAKSDYYADKRKDKNKPNSAPGMWVSPAMQVNDAHGNAMGTSYRRDMHTKEVLAGIIEKGSFKYNMKVFRRYGLNPLAS